MLFVIRWANLRNLTAAIKQETSARDAGFAKIDDKLKETLVGDWQLAFVGLVYLFIGIILRDSSRGDCTTNALLGAQLISRVLKGTTTASIPIASSLGAFTDLSLARSIGRSAWRPTRNGGYDLAYQ